LRGARIERVPDYGQYCPIALAAEVVSDRWTPLILRELWLGNTRFNELVRGLPGISRTVLTQRLRHLERHGVLELWPSAAGRGNEYRLTPAGQDLATVLESMGRWAITWLYDELRSDDVDAQTLMWWMHRRVDPATFPPGRVVVEFEHTAPQRQRIWLVLDHGEASVCMQHPGYDSDVVVRTSTPTLGAVFGGFDTWASAVAGGRIELLGPPRLTRALPGWFRWSPFAEGVRARGAMPHIAGATAD